MSLPSLARPTIAEIDLANLRANLRSSRSFIGEDLTYLAVVKADGYGHGARECARALRDEGAGWLGVATPEEAFDLRTAGLDGPILCMGGFWPGQEDYIIGLDLTTVVFSVELAARLNAAAAAADQIVQYHVKIDTGMGRVGIRFDDLEVFARALLGFNNLRLDGLMTHFAAADDLTDDFTDLQVRRFYDAVDVFKAAGHDTTYIDLANSPGAVAHPDARGNMVRLGGILYGLGGDVLPDGIPKPTLKPVMSLHTAITQIKRVPAGETIGYGRTFTTKRDTQIGTIPIGYHDGYPRALSNKGHVLVNERPAPVLGRVSMDWTVIDLTDAPDVKIGDRVTVMGRQGGLSVTAEDLAKLTNTISYEITCGISSRVPRRYIESDE
ncbi:MAG: alanine racemase [Pyrinomonadaceae bacterium]